MDRVRIKPARGTGREKMVRPRQAEVLVKLGAYVYADPPPPAAAPAPEPTGYAAMTYNDLRALAAERAVEVEGRKKDDFVDALNAADEAPPETPTEPEAEAGADAVAAGTYQRRDMRAEE